ncbi:epididymal sperm-binding protein 1-like [Varanus komodoensis]|uniref:epididymal sperm-binding protein 1-like n=1 Tax=Varanus komodoensis TaxID=61221 RepID=UPI001CF7B7E4|nr:epididymal sperm-binding protein 1-like [Varanus komodoensis]
MASFIAFLVYSWVLLSLAAGQVTYPESPACKFPFIYEGKAFTTCTEYGSTDKTPWCATTSNYDRDRKWKPCAVKEYGGNSNGAPCTFPFIYLGRTYYTCTNKFEHKGRYWCATTGSYDKDRKWSFCADIKLSVNYPEDPCRFPFTYKGKTYSGCTGAGREDGKLWCSISKNHDDNSQLVFCEPSDPAPCYFPFKYKKKSYSDCTMNGSFDGHLWCATTADYDKDSKWKACITEEYGGNSNGGQCVFPFTYMDKEYTTCTNEDTDGRFWCATTANYDKDKKWSFCADTRMSNGEIVKPGNVGSSKAPCSFPFIYKGKTYTECTSKGTLTWKLWCSLTSNYDRDKRWRYCQPSDLETQNQLQSNEEKQTINISKIGSGHL